MFPIASVKFLAAHEPDSSMPSGFGRPWASIRALVAATTTMAVLILRRTVASSFHPRHQKDGSPSRRTRRRIPPGCIRLFLELRGDDVGSFQICRVVDDCGPHDDGRAVRFLEQIDVLEQGGSTPLGTTRMRSGWTPADTSARRTPSEIAITRSTARL
jgi:hypothetical protein